MKSTISADGGRCRQAGAPLTIRAPRPEEAGLLTAIALRAKAHWGYDADFMRRCRQELVRTPAQLRENREGYGVAELRDSVVGFYELRALGHARIELEALFVDPGVLGQGIGRRLFAHACERALKSGARRLEIQSDPHAEGFYLAMGAVRTGRAPSGSIAGRYLPVLTLALNPSASGKLLSDT